MSQAQGSSFRLKLAPESTWGTKPASVSAVGSVIIPVASANLDVSQPMEQNTNIRNTRQYGPGVLGAADCRGGVEFSLNGNDHGQVLKALLGTISTSATSVAYSHKFTVGSTLPSYTAEAGFTDVSQYFWLTGVKMAAATFTMEPTGFCRVSVTVAGKGQDSSSPSATSYHSGSTSNTDAVFAMTSANMAITEGGAPIATVSALNFTVDNGLDTGVYALSTDGYRADLPAGMTRVTGTLTALFDETIAPALVAKAVAGTETAIVVTLQNGTGDGTAGNEQLVIHLDEVRYGVALPKVGGSQGVSVELPFEATYSDDSDASCVWFQLKNSLATYL